MRTLKLSQSKQVKDLFVSFQVLGGTCLAITYYVADWGFQIQK